MRIRPAQAEDLDLAVAVASTAGWGDMRSQFAFHFAHPDCRLLVAGDHGAVIGTAVGTRRGATGWIGQVIVLPEHRGRGIGTALTQAVADGLEAAGCRTLLLIATELGRPVYEKLGFTVETEYCLFRGPVLAGMPPSPHLRRLIAYDLQAVCELDRQASGEDRSAQLRSLAGAGWVWADSGDAMVQGFYVPAPWGGGPVVALESRVGRDLLELTRVLAGQAGAAEVPAAVPAANGAGREHLARAGFREVGRLPRMVRGEPLRWDPTRVWGRFSGAMG